MTVGPWAVPMHSTPVRPVFPAARDWVARLGAEKPLREPVPSSRWSPSPDVTRLEYTDCAARTRAVVLFTIHGGGHTWPGGEPSTGSGSSGPRASSIDATRQMWAFFREHQRLR